MSIGSCYVVFREMVNVPAGSPYVGSLTDKFALVCIPFYSTDDCIADGLLIENLAQKNQACNSV